MRSRSPRPLRFATAALLTAALWSTQALAASPSVVATIKPVAAIAAALMQGTQAKPHLLVDGNGSPHVYSLKPSDASALQRADLILWIGPGLETFLDGALTTLPQHARVLELMKAPGLTLLPYHAGNEWEPDDDDHDHGAGHELTEEAHTDPHLWLNPANVSAMAEMVAHALGDIAPENKALYASNLAALRLQMQQVDSETRTQLAPVAARPFIVFHDGYQYLANHYGLANVGSVTLSADREPGAGRIRDLHRRFEAEQVACLFTEPQFEPRLARTVTEGSRAKIGTLDPLGVSLPADGNYYPRLYKALAGSLTACLG